MLNGYGQATKGCRCDVCEAYRRRRGRNWALRKMGRPMRCNTREVARAQAHVVFLVSCGMSCRSVADQTGASLEAIRRFAKGQQPGITRATYERILAFTSPVEQTQFNGKHGGPRTNPTGTVRRVRALAALGFGFGWMAEQLGNSRANNSFKEIAAGGREFVSYRMHYHVRMLYRTYQNADPIALGHNVTGVVKMRNEARRKRWAPPGAWDEDTIDDPATEPEWTGACGTPRGYWMHRQFRLPMCGRCREAHERENTDDRSKEAAA